MKPRGRTFRVEGVNFGNGEPVLCSVRVTSDLIIIRRFRARRAWVLSLQEAAGLIARRAQTKLVA